MLRTLEIWLVEDDPSQVELFKILAQKYHSTVSIRLFSSGKTLLEGLPGIFNKEKTTVVLSDLNLPDMSGTELLEALRKDAAYHAIRFILFTQMRDSRTLADTYANGAAAILPKPQSLEEYKGILHWLVSFWSLVDC